MKKLLLLSFIISTHSLFCADAESTFKRKIKNAFQKDNSKEIDTLLSDKSLKPNDQIDNAPLLVYTIKALAPHCVKTLLDANADPNSTFNNPNRVSKGPSSPLTFALHQKEVLDREFKIQKINDYHSANESDDECENVTRNDIKRLDNIIVLLQKNNKD